MPGPANRRRGGRFTTLVVLVAQGLLVMASPLADVHYHRRTPLNVGPAGDHALSPAERVCPQCLALQTLAVPGTPRYVLAADRAPGEPPVPAVGLGGDVARFFSVFARAPPLSRARPSRLD